MQMLRTICKQNNFDCAFILSEAWIKRIHTSAPLTDLPRPSECEDREEIFVVSYQDKEKACFFNAPITRDFTTGEASIGELTCFEGEQVGGRLLDIF